MPKEQLSQSQTESAVSLKEEKTTRTMTLDTVSLPLLPIPIPHPHAFLLSLSSRLSFFFFFLPCLKTSHSISGAEEDFLAWLIAANAATQSPQLSEEKQEMEKREGKGATKQRERGVQEAKSI